MDITLKDVKQSLNGIVIAKNSPWIKFLIRYKKDVYQFIEKDENLNITTVLYTSPDINDVIWYINNYFGEDFLHLKGD